VIFAVHQQWARSWSKTQVVGHARNERLYVVQSFGL
jgi:hypothetical protein